MTTARKNQPGGWAFRPTLPIMEPLDFATRIPVASDDHPLTLHLIFTDDGLYVPAVIRQPAGLGPFPTVVCIHGGSGGLGIPYLIDQVLNRGYVYDRLLAEGYAICYTEGRAEIEGAYGTDIPATLDHQDIIAVFRYLQRQLELDPGKIAFFGVSHGGELQMKMIAEIQAGPAALIPGEPAVGEFLGLQHDGPWTEAALQYREDQPDSKFEMERVWPRCQAISATVPILVLGRDGDHMQGVFRKLHELLQRAGKNVEWASWDHPDHTYQFGPQRGIAGYEADPVQQDTLDYIVEFLNKHVRDKS